jgi:hypothetical protein
LPVTRIRSRKLDAISEWLLANNIPLTRENWIDINWFGEKTEEDLEGEDLCAIRINYSFVFWLPRIAT